MNILIIGSGGREHAIAWKISQEHDVDAIFIAPGNAGTCLEYKCSNIDLDPLDFTKLAKFALDNNCLTIVGPEAPLVAGIVDYFNAQNLPIFGPNKAAAILEGSKVFTKNFLLRNNIPTAAYQEFSNLKSAHKYVQSLQKFPIVIKADGLASGKGVVIAHSVEESIRTLTDMMQDHKFGDAGSRVVIEEFLVGEEASFIVVVDGKNVVSLATSQDHKRAYDNDKGENTGGMGAYSPAPVVTDSVHTKIMERIIYPTVQAMRKEGREYKGFLYAGLIIDSNGNPYVIEFNCRLGDPETQPLLFRMQSSLLELIQKAIDSNLNNYQIDYSNKVSIGVVIAASGYPGNYQKGADLDAIRNLNIHEHSKIFHAGTSLQNGKIISTGGRVLCVTAKGNNIQEARDRAYALVKQVQWDCSFYRSDIAFRAISKY